MSDELHLPAHREMPPELRARLRRRVFDEIEERPTVANLRRATPYLAAAAAAAALAGGMIIIGGQNHHHRNAPVAAGTIAELHRCWKAVEHAGKQSAYPARSKWTVDLQQTGGIHGVDMLAVKAGDKAVFCGLTPTTVRISAPVTAASTEVKPILAIPNGPIAGVSDGRSTVHVTVQHHGNQWYGPNLKLSDDRQLFTLAGPMTSQTRIYEDFVDPTYRKPKNQLPAPPAPAIERVDHPERQGGGDAQGRDRLAKCSSQAAPSPLRTPFDTLTPRAMTAHSLLATHGRTYLLCYDDFKAVEQRASKQRATRSHPVVARVHVERGAKRTGSNVSMSETLAGDVHSSVARLTFTNHARTTTATLHNGTFLVDMPLTVPASDEGAFDAGKMTWPVRAKAYDEHGNLIFSRLIRPTR